MARLEWYIRANLKPRHMQLLIALDDLRLVGRVAELLNITQPAVSKSLAEIERGLGLQLFDRGRHGLVPTVYGESMVRLCRSMQASLDAAGDELRRLQAGAAGRIRVGVLPVAAPVLVPRAVIALQRTEPRTIVVLHEATADRLLPMLRDEQLDLVVGNLPPATESAGLDIEVLHPGEGVAVVCGGHHPLADRARVEAADLAPYPLIIPPRGSIFREVVQSVLGALALDALLATVESGSMTASNTLLRETDAIGFYSQHLAHHYARFGWLRQLPVGMPNIAVPLGIVRLRHGRRPVDVEPLARQLRAVAAAELASVAADAS